MKKNIKYILAAVLLLVLAGGMLFVRHRLRPAEFELGNKSINVTVVHGDGTKNVFSFSGDAENLRTPLENAGLISGEESAYGLFIRTVDGESADEAKQQWWCITKDGQETETGVDSIRIADGDRYEFTLKEGW